MTRALVGLGLLCAGSVHAGDLPSNPAQRVAAKALRGYYGPLPNWQRVGYTAILRGPVREMVAWRTHYTPREGTQALRDRYGNRCSTRTLASNRLPRRAWVLVLGPQVELRQNLDCGAKSNDRRFADRNGADCWIDLWTSDERLRNVGGPVRIAVAR